MADGIFELWHLDKYDHCLVISIVLGSYEAIPCPAQFLHFWVFTFPEFGDPAFGQSNISIGNCPSMHRGIDEAG